MSKCILLSEIRIDGGTQPREAINQATVDEYAEAMTQLVSFPPLIVYHDGVDTWLADGFHRYHAARKIGASALDVEWRIGTLEKAKLYAASANAAHGLRRTDGDKRLAIKMVLSTDEGGRWTQQQIAKHCNVDRSYVSRVKAECDSHNPPKNPPPAQATKVERKRADIAAAITAAPAASDRAIGRRLGVDRETVASVRGQAKAPPGAPATGGGTPSSAREPPRGGYSTADASKVAYAAVEWMRSASTMLTDDDWKLLLAEIGEIR